MTTPARTLRAHARAVAAEAAETGARVRVTLPDGTVIEAEPPRGERGDDLALVDMSKR